MASNTIEWTTEYSTYRDDTIAYPCTRRGGYFYSDSWYMNARGSYNATYSHENYTFRLALYM